MSKRTTPDDGYKDDQPLQKKAKLNDKISNDNNDNILAPEAAHNTLFNKLHNIRSQTLNTNSKHKHTKMLKDIYTNTQSKNERNRQEQAKQEKHIQEQLAKQERDKQEQLANKKIAQANKKIAQENMCDISQTSYNDMVNGYIREHETTEFLSDKHSFYKFIPNLVNYLCIRYYIKDTFVKLPYLFQINKCTLFRPMPREQLKFIKITDDTFENMMNTTCRIGAGFILENVAYKETHQWKFKVLDDATISIFLALKKALNNVKSWLHLPLKQNSVIDLNLDFNKLEYKIMINNEKDVEGHVLESGVYSVCICCTKCKIQLVSYKTSQ